jgi:hypothetical protein
VELVSPDQILERFLGFGKLQAMAVESRRKIADMLLPATAAAIELTLPPSQIAPPKVLPDRGFARAKARTEETFRIAEDHAVRVEQARVEVAIRLDPWQKQALEILADGKNLVVDAPTSAGKTRVVERLIEERMDKGLRLIYTSPVKSLSNDKYREFSEKFGREKVGINTGDFKENLGAPIILATLETYRNSLLGVEPRMDRMVVVYDEYHYLQDEGRGSAWEESIVLTPKESQLVLLSASVPNAEQFAGWISDLKEKPCEVVRVTERPVPLVDLVHTQYGWVLGDLLRLKGNELQELRDLGKAIRQDQKRNFRRAPSAEKFLHLIRPVSDALAENMGPVVVYAGRRADTEGVAYTLARRLNTPFQGEGYEKLNKRLENLQGWEYVPPELQRMIQKTGIAYHHSGLIPPGRVAIESLLKEGLLRVCSGTMGISLGVNFAVRSAIVSDESRPSEGGETRYSNTEIMQMLGRAGRRGKDRQGFSMWLNAARYASQKPYGREPCQSSLKFDPTTVLGVLGQRESFAYLSEFYRKSFFMRGKDPETILVADHDLLSGFLYKEGFDVPPCDNIPQNYAAATSAGKKQRTQCDKCPAKAACHPLCESAKKSFLNTVVAHLQTIGALDGSVPTEFGQLARHFPQSGGLIFAKWVATKKVRAKNLAQYIQAMACFCAAHHKDVPSIRGDNSFLESMCFRDLIDFYYPESVFPEQYDEQFKTGNKVFREFNFGGASVVSMWLEPGTSWEALVEAHEGKTVSAGDCMMMLFRCATLLQSCMRLKDTHPDLADEAARLREILLREPLNSRNRMLLETEEDKVEEEKIEEDEESNDEGDEDSDDEETAEEDDSE